MMLHTNESTNGRGEECLLYPLVFTFLGSRIAYLLHLKSEEAVGGRGGGGGRDPDQNTHPHSVPSAVASSLTVGVCQTH